MAKDGKRKSKPMEGSSMSSTLLESDLDTHTITKAYARWAPVYDLVFGAVFERGRHAAVAAAARVGKLSLSRIFATCRFAV